MVDNISPTPIEKITDGFLIPVWRVQAALRDYAGMMERAEVPQLDGPGALREMARVVGHMS
jgi:hypothetical protein